MTKFIIAGVVAVVVIAIGTYFFIFRQPAGDMYTRPDGFTPATSTPDTSESPTETKDDSKTVIGTSTQGRAITAYHYGQGEKELLFVGGIHGGYSWNTSLLAYELMDHLSNNLEAIPEGVRVTVIPVLNPDGLSKVVSNVDMRFAVADVAKDQTTRVAGRFNGHEVDLNRNFDCEWKQTATWQQRQVNPGTRAFSESESQALRAYVTTHRPTAAVVWYSSAGGVFASSCGGGVSQETKILTDTYAKASGYRAYQEFNFYEITGDMVNWLAKSNIPAISVLLTTHDAIEWEKNWKGIEALFNQYAR